MAVQRGGSLVSTSLVAMLVAGVVAGGIVGLVLGGVFTNQVVLAIVCAFVAAILALVIGYAMLGRDTQLSLPSGVVVWNVIFASLLSGLAGHELGVDLRNPPASPLVGALSGILAAMLIASFAITIYMLRSRLTVPQR
jgi:hypothetical protein